MKKPFDWEEFRMKAWLVFLAVVISLVLANVFGQRAKPPAQPPLPGSAVVIDGDTLDYREGMAPFVAPRDSMP